MKGYKQTMYIVKGANPPIPFMTFNRLQSVENLIRQMTETALSGNISGIGTEPEIWFTLDPNVAHAQAGITVHLEVRVKLHDLQDMPEEEKPEWLK